MNHKKERKSGVACDVKSCHYWDERPSHRQRCWLRVKIENGSPVNIKNAAISCEQYFPQREAI